MRLCVFRDATTDSTLFSPSAGGLPVAEAESVGAVMSAKRRPHSVGPAAEKRLKQIFRGLDFTDRHNSTGKMFSKEGGL